MCARVRVMIHKVIGHFQLLTSRAFFAKPMYYFFFSISFSSKFGTSYDIRKFKAKNDQRSEWNKKKIGLIFGWVAAKELTAFENRWSFSSVWVRVTSWLQFDSMKFLLCQFFTAKQPKINHWKKNGIYHKIKSPHCNL